MAIPGCYVPQFLPAAFKGVPFEAVDASSEHGRRGAEAEFPFSEISGYADLGRRIRRYKLKARFVENSHVADSGRLIRACESPGPGTLVHPTRGVVRAACKSIRVHDELIDGVGQTIADLEFVEANDWISGLSVAASLIGVSVTPAVAAAGGMFAAAYSIASIPFYAQAAAISVVQSAVGTIGRALSGAAGISTDRTYWQVSRDLDAIAVSPIQSGRTETAWLGLSGGMAAIDRYATDPEAKWQAVRTVANWAAGQSMPAQSTAVQSADAVVASTRILSAAYLARTAMEIEHATLQDALRQYDAVATVLDQELAAARLACRDGLFMQLSDFAADARSKLLNRAYNLPAMVQFDFGGAVSSRVAAHEIFGDAREFASIERNNATAWPFVLGPLVTAPRQSV